MDFRPIKNKNKVGIATTTVLLVAIAASIYRKHRRLTNSPAKVGAVTNDVDMYHANDGLSN